jgi:hypothetical protein
MSNEPTHKFRSLWVDPLSDARKRRDQLLRERALLDAAGQPEAYEQLSSQINFEEDFIASFTDFKKETTAKKRGPMSLSAKGILQLLGIAVLWFVVIGIWRRYFG